MRAWMAVVFCGAVALAGCGKIEERPAQVDAQDAPDDAAVDAPGGPAANDAAVADAPVVDASDGDAPAPSIPARVLVSGNAQKVTGATQQPCACVLELVEGGTRVLARSNTDAAGSFVLTVATNGAPVNVDLAADADTSLGLFGARFAFAAPLAADRSVDLRLLDTAAFQRLQGLAGEPTTTQRSLVIVHVLDDNGRSLSGATVAIDQAGIAVHYSDGAGQPVPAPSRTTTAGDGLAFLFNASSRPTITVTAPGMTFAPRTLSVTARNTHTLEVAP